MTNWIETHRGAVPPWPALQVARAMGWQVDVSGLVQMAPGGGCVERMVRIGE